MMMKMKIVKTITINDKMKFSKTYYLISMIALTVLFECFISCDVTRSYQRPTAYLNDKLYRNASTNDTTTIATIPWQQFFTDTILQQLIQEGIQNNLNLKIAVTRIKAAEASYTQSIYAFFPTLNANLSVTAQKPGQTKALPATTTASQLYQPYLSSNYQLGLWGQLRSAKRAQLNALLATEAAQRAVQTQLISDIASNYYSLLALDAQLTTTKATVQNRKDDLATMKVLKESDVVTSAAVVQSAAGMYGVQVTIPDIELSIQKTENAISILLGKAPDSLQRTTLEAQVISDSLSTGVPAQLLANRPDVQEAEYNYRYYFQLTNVARTYFYPSITITAQAGLLNSSLTNFFSSASVFTSIAGGITQPIFNQGINRQRLTVAKANQEEYLYTYEQTLLNAGNDVSNALASFNAAREKRSIRDSEIVNLQKAVDYTKELLKYTSNTNYTDVLTSEQNLLSAQLSSINDQLQMLQARVSLYISLGGGWR
jgi:NodT family efflux transporter outer membrane factor (OMF) lipoprotein